MSDSPRTPRDDQAVPVSQEALLDRLCDEFECALKAGKNPRIESFLERLPEGARSLGLKELLGIELEIRRAAGEPLLSDNYLHRFARHREIVEAELQRCLGNLGEATTCVGDAGTAAAGAEPAGQLCNGRPDQSAEPVPQQVGRFEIRGVLGEGGFGRVFLGRDPDLDRAVAIKVPNPRRFTAGFNVAAFFAEARHAAKLKHPGLVTVYEVQQDVERPYIVQEYIDGSSLGKWFREQRPSYRDIVRILIEVSEAVGFAHQHGLIHRDLKPANILIDSQGHAHVADFGLALDQNRRSERLGAIDGTRPYMSPEQFRGETHRLDGRTDLWSLGIVMYELLVQSRPFSGRTDDELLASITTLEPLPPRQLDPRVPRELERICLKCLEKRRADRFTAAADLADDLRHWLATSDASDAAPATGTTAATARDSESSRIAIVPKGLRAFDEHDADFFLELLPGPRDRDGLPESIRFWKTRIEETDPDRVFSVGLLYGPSGCGKSSLVRAGLLPRLASRVAAVYVEATAQDTEVRLLKGLRKQVPQLPAAVDLPASLLWLRENLRPRDRKILIVLDQFEQWLHAHSGADGRQLIDALRHCDGTHLQCLVLVRDDFYAAVNRFFRELEIPIVEGQNYALVDLFDQDHARKVLTAFGRAYGKLPETTAQLTAEQRTFIAQSVSGLTQEGRVICVRLALFAEMMKGRTWTPDSLREVGGTEGVGVTFLEETFSAHTAPPAHRLHQNAARAVLNALLPERGSDIKGQMRSDEELRAASGYGQRPDAFAELVQILDRQLRLITPTDPDAVEGGGSPDPVEVSHKYYQLAHDYLVPAVREWLTQKQRETPGGRARLLLAERATLWNARPEPKQLPSQLEWLAILWRTQRAHWSVSQRRMMDVATRRHAAVLVGNLALIAVVAVVVLAARWLWLENRQHEQADQLVDRLLVADMSRVAGTIDELERLPGDWRSRLARIGADDGRPASERLHAHLALVRWDAHSVPFLVEHLVESEPDEFAVILQALQPGAANSQESLWSIALNDTTPAERRFRAAVALAGLDPEAVQWDDIAGATATALVRTNLLTAPEWTRMIRPARRHLLRPLAAEFIHVDAPESQRTLAASILADYGADDPNLLAQLLQQANAGQFQILFPAVKVQAERCAEVFRNVVGDPGQAPGDDVRARTHRRANAVIALFLLHRFQPAFDMLGQSADPDLRTALIDQLPAIVEFDELWSKFEELPNSLGRQALLLALDGLRAAGKLTPEHEQRLSSKLAELFVLDESPAVHSAVEWLFRRLRKTEELDALTTRLRGTQRAGWRVSAAGHTMAVIRGPVDFQIGSPADEPRRDLGEDQSRRRIAASYEIGTHEVTVVQFQDFFPNHRFAADVAPTPDCPINYITWYDVARYCRRLGEVELIADDEQIFPPVDQIREDRELILPANWLQRTGYRLPTEAEWEYACRGGTVTMRFFGTADEPLTRYGWSLLNARERCWPVGLLRPNPFGLFDMLGNVGEWCYDRRLAYAEAPAPDSEAGRTIAPAPQRIFRGGVYQQMSKDLRAAKRDGERPDRGYSYNGFRLARTLPQVAP
jgi:serine/threonine protein kinase/formylglycine-generating enzyme required for sulfatase activity